MESIVRTSTLNHKNMTKKIVRTSALNHLKIVRTSVFIDKSVINMLGKIEVRTI